MVLNKIKNIYIVVLLGIIAFVLLANYLKNYENKELNNMVVVLSAKVLKDDVFQLFYQETPESKFKIEKSVRVNIKGSDVYQDITFELPKIQDLFRLRLDIGENLDQNTVVIKEIKFLKENEEFVFGANGFNRLFAPNKYVTASDNGGFLGKHAVIDSKPVYDPYFISVDSSQEMELLKTDRLTHYPYLIAAFVCLVVFLFVVYNMSRILVSQKGIFIVAFMVILILPALQNKIQFAKPLQNLEKRELAKKPKFSFTKEFARGYEAYFNDNFGLRNNLVNWGGRYRTKLFRSSMHPEIAKFGKEKWLFYNKVGGRMYRSYSRTGLLPADKLKQLADKWEDYKKRYESDERRHFMVFWPNKHSIYPEYMPYAMKIQIKDTLSRVDQIIQYLRSNNSHVQLLDVRPTLLSEKKNKLLYHKFDTHWNSYGAFLAYQQFFKENKDRLGILPKTTAEFDISWKDYTGGELIQMLGVHNKGFFIEKKPTFVLKENKDQIEYLPIDGYPRLTVITRNQHSGNKLRALIFRDSFTNSLIQFFSLHFYEVYYIWGHQEKFVEKLQPDIVIDGFVEREIGEHIQ